MTAQKTLESGNTLTVRITFEDGFAKVRAAYRLSPTEADLAEGRKIIESAMDAGGFNNTDEWSKL